MIADELAHLVKQLVSQAMIDQRPFVYGHIASYDAATHRVRCIIPSMTDENGTPLLGPWMPMGTLSAGAGYGLQIAYAGGATIENPTGGEQVLIGLFDRHRGVSAVPAMFFSGSSQPPSEKLPDGAPPVAAGDVMLSNPSKTLLRIHPNGDFEIYGTGKLIANTTGDASVTTKGNASITATGTVTVTATGDATVTTQGNVSVNATGTATITATAIKLTKAAGDLLRGFCTTRFQAVYNSHTHATSASTPLPQADATTVTSVVLGE